MDEYYIQNDRFYVNDGEKAIFRLLNTTILDYTSDELRVKSKSLDKLIPILTKIQSQYNLENSFVLDNFGLSLKIKFANSDISLKDIIDKRFHYNLELALYCKSDKQLIFKIIRITNKKYVDFDYPEPDHFDIQEIRNSINSKVEAYKNKFCELTKSVIDSMSLPELIDLEENLCDFISNN